MPRNISLFIAFRLLFNARFYYPIFAVIQLDYGLTMSQFAILNAVWAVSIILLEVPSGGLSAAFPMDPATQHRFLNGLDDVGITLTHAGAIDDYEANRPAWLR